MYSTRVLRREVIELRSSVRGQSSVLPDSRVSCRSNAGHGCPHCALSMRILLYAVFQRAISLPPTIPTNIHSWPRRRLDVTMRINNLAMALPYSSAPTMPTAVRPTPISGENSASVMAAPPTSGDQPINIAHVPTPSPPGAPDRDCAAGVHCMADRTADDRHAPRSRACRRGDERRGRGDEGEEGGGGVGVSSCRKTTRCRWNGHRTNSRPSLTWGKRKTPPQRSERGSCCRTELYDYLVSGGGTID